MKKQKILLLVEDDAPCASLMAAYCEMAGASPTVVDTFEQAVAILKLRPFDLVLLDLGLPDSPPSRTLEGIPRLIALGAAIVVITGMPKTDELYELIVHAGAIGMIEKGQPEITARLREILASEPNKQK
jgi:DNA-binding response OmpR family regulator